MKIHGLILTTIALLCSSTFSYSQDCEELHENVQGFSNDPLEARHQSKDSKKHKRCKRGPTGPTGPTGATGPTGPTGSFSSCFATFFDNVIPFPTPPFATFFIDVPQNSATNSGCVSNKAAFFSVDRAGVYLISYTMSFTTVPNPSFSGVFRSTSLGVNPIPGSIVQIADPNSTPIIVSHTFVTHLTPTDQITLQLLSNTAGSIGVIGSTISFVFISP